MRRCDLVVMQQGHQPSREPLPAILHTGSVGCCIPQAASQQTASIQLQISEIACSGIDDRFLHALLAAAQCCMLLNTVHMHLPHKCCSIGTTTYPIPPEACALKYASQACIVKALWRALLRCRKEAQSGNSYRRDHLDAFRKLQLR